MLSAIFTALVIHDLFMDQKKTAHGEAAWHNLRKLQVTTGKINGDGVEVAEAEQGQQLSMLRIKLAEGEKKVRNYSTTTRQHQAPATEACS